MSIVGNRGITRLRKEYLVSLAALVVVATLSAPQGPASAMSMRGFGGGGHSIGGFGHSMGGFGGHSIGGLGHSMSGLGHSTGGFSRSVGGLGHSVGGLNRSVSGARPVHGSRFVNTSARNTAGNHASTADARKPTVTNRPVAANDGNRGAGANEPAAPKVERANLDGGRDAGAGMKMRPGTEKRPSWAEGYNPETHQTWRRTFNGDGTFVDTAVVSYGWTEDTGVVRVDDNPKIKAKIQNDCHLLAAKVTALAKELSYEQRVLAALQGAQNVNISDTITGVSTSFASEDDQQAAVARMQAKIGITAQLLAQYQLDLNRCLMGGN
jgi:hypothetical protein